MRNVLVYRESLLPFSETFVIAQGEGLRRYHAHYVGLGRTPGLSLPPERTHVLGEALSAPGAHAMFKLAGRIPRRVRDELAALSPALVHAHFGTAAPEAMWIAQSLGIPCVLTFHGFDATVVPRPRAITLTDIAYWLLRRKILDRISVFIAVSEFIARCLVARGIPPEAIVRHSIGIDVDRFPIRGLEGRRREVLFVGRLVEKKGLIHLLRAMEIVRRELPDTRLVVLGDGPLRAAMEQEARNRGLDADFLGVRSATLVSEWMRTARILGMPSVRAANGDSEGLGMVALESMASGMPVAAFDHGGIGEAVAHGQTGLLCKEGDSVALADRLCRLLRDDALWSAFSKAGRSRVVESFDLARQTAKLEAIYDGAIERYHGGLA